MAREFTPREAGAIAWQADMSRNANPYRIGTRNNREWTEGWDAEDNAFEDAAFFTEFGETLGGTRGWIGSADHLAEARAFGLTALD